jgi:hypothetical protein
LSHVTTTIVYDSHDNPTSVTDALSHAVTTTYTTYGQPNVVKGGLEFPI